MKLKNLTKVLIPLSISTFVYFFFQMYWEYGRSDYVIGECTTVETGVYAGTLFLICMIRCVRPAHTAKSMLLFTVAMCVMLQLTARDLVPGVALSREQKLEPRIYGIILISDLLNYEEYWWTIRSYPLVYLVSTAVLIDVQK